MSMDISMDKDKDTDMNMSMSKHEHEHVISLYMLAYMVMYLFVFRCIYMHLIEHVNKHAFEHVHEHAQEYVHGHVHNHVYEYYTNIYINMYVHEHIVFICMFKFKPGFLISGHFHINNCTYSNAYLSRFLDVSAADMQTFLTPLIPWPEGGCSKVLFGDTPGVRYPSHIDLKFS
jgi:hypothetical protein